MSGCTHGGERLTCVPCIRIAAIERERNRLVEELRACVHPPRSRYEIEEGSAWCLDCGAFKDASAAGWLHARIVAGLVER